MYIINITMQELSRKSQTTEICWAREREEREEEGEMEREREKYAMEPRAAKVARLTCERDKLA